MSVDPAVEPQFQPVPKPEDFETPQDQVGDDPAVATPIKKSALPTRKLSYAAVTAAILYVVSLFVHTGNQEIEQVVNVVVPLILAYIIPNADTPGGLPVTRA